MRKFLASIGVAIIALSPAVAVEPMAQTPAQNPVGSPPGDSRFADPFFAPPDGRPVMDPWRPGSGSAAADTMVPHPAPFRPERLWFATDFYHAVGQGTLLPPLVTTAPVGTLPGAGGALNEPSTRILFGGERALNQFRPGLRANAGLWLTEDYRLGIDATFLYLGDVSSSFSGTTSPTGPLLARPVYLGNSGTQIGVSVGSFAPGTLSARATSAVIGGDANIRYGLSTSEMGRLDFFLGYRYLNLCDTVEVDSQTRVVAVPTQLSILPIFDFSVSDRFRTTNQFHGGQIGLGGTHRLFGRLTLTTKATIAVGVNISDVTIAGETTTPLGTVSGGLLTGADNIGSMRDNFFSVMPEATAKLGWDVTDRIRVNAGYSALFWTNVRRAADQIDTTIQSRGRPGFPNDGTTYWLQGWTVGLDLRY